MKLKLITVALAFASVPAFAAMGTTEIPTFAGQAAAAEAAKTAVPTTPEGWVERMTDFTRNLSAFKDPQTFLPWLHNVTEPGFYIAAMNGMMDPGGWLNMMNSMAHPDAVRNYLQFADPAIHVKWTLASLDPNFYIALLTQMTDPGKLLRWAVLPVDPRLWNVFLNTLNPNTYIRWGMSPLDPRAWNLAGTLANPALYTGMLGAVVNPFGYGEGTTSWLTWKPAPAVQGAGSFSMWDPVAMLGNLSGFLPGLQGFSLPQLPQIGLPSLPVPDIPLLFSTPPAPTYKIQSQATPAVASQDAEVEPEPEAEPEPVATLASEPETPVTPAPAVAAEPTPVVVPAPAPEVKPATAATEPAAAVVAPAPVAVPAPEAVPAPVVVAAPVVAPAPVVVSVPEPAVNKVVLAGDALFKSGKFGIKDLSREGKAKLDEVVAKLKGVGEIDQIKVVGHADPTGKTKANQTLSEARAKSVKSYLIAKGVKPNVIITSGVGDTQPVVQCDAKLPSAQLKECHAPNRRVEIEIQAKGKGK